MTFTQYYAQISAAVFPEGEAENLVHVHKLAVKDALIDLQTKIPCLRTENADYVGQASTLFHCGSSTFDTVDGNIERVYTTIIDEGCSEVEYTYIDQERMNDMIHSYRCCIASDAYGMNPYTPNHSTGAPIYVTGSPSTDKGYRTGKTQGYWSMNRGTIYVFPSIESTEQIVVEWNGIRRTFTEATVIPVTFEDRDVMGAVELYLEAQVARRETKDMGTFQTASKAYADAIANLAWDCRRKQKFVRETRLVPPDAC
jgi:hypothetical protein